MVLPRNCDRAGYMTDQVFSSAAKQGLRQRVTIVHGNRGPLFTELNGKLFHEQHAFLGLSPVDQGYGRYEV